MKNRRYDIAKLNRVRKRMISFAAAVTLCFTSVPFADMSNDIHQLAVTIKASAAVDPANPLTFGSIEEFVKFSQDYNSNPIYANTYKNAELRLQFGDKNLKKAFQGFESIGTSASPFEGSIYINDGIILNIDKPLFDWVTDDATLSPGGRTISIARTTPSTTPLLANHVCANNNATAEWSVQYTEFKPDQQGSMQDISGLIGEIQDSANVNVKEFTYTSGVDGVTGANIVGTGNVGLICGTMGTNSTLHVQSFTNLTDTIPYSVSTSGGSAGGIVGVMKSGSELKLGTESTAFSNPQLANQTITASGYAGGIVGECRGGKITFVKNDATYTITQQITGGNGAGGIAGVYSTNIAATTSSAPYSINTEKYIIASGTQVNGTGNCGGLFGVLINDGYLKIEGSTPVTILHGGTDKAESYGGLIGHYAAVNLEKELSLEVSGMVSTSRSAGAGVYGGLIGTIDKYTGETVGEETVNACENAPAYIAVCGVTVSAGNANADLFGGIAGSAAGSGESSAKSSYISLSGTNTITNRDMDASHDFGGVIGALGDGVLQLNGTTDLSSSGAADGYTSNSGQIVGTRDCGLVFAETWTLNRAYKAASGSNPATWQKLDDIGSWGEVLRGDAVAGITVHEITESDKNHYVTLAPAPSSLTGLTQANFILTALNIQHNTETRTTGVLRTGNTLSGTLLESTMTIGDVDLRGTGITGLTRDNGSTAVEFTGSLAGISAATTLTLAVGEHYPDDDDTDGGTIFRHQYSGLIAKTSGTASVSNLTLDGESVMSIQSKGSDMRAGFLVAEQGGTSLTIDGITTSSVEKSINNETVTYKPTIGYGDESGSIHVGGFIGRVGAGNTVIGNNTACSFDGAISGTSTGVTVGGLIGSIANHSFTSSLMDTTISGSVSAAVSETGGLIGVIDGSSSSRSLTLKGINISGLSVTNSTSSSVGGMLGYSWEDTDVSFEGYTDSSSNIVPGVKVGGSSALTASNSEKGAAGLVYLGTGHWQVHPAGIKLDSLTISEPKVESFGMILNQGYSLKTENKKTVINHAVYLELLAKSITLGKAYEITSSGVPTSGIKSSAVFDEIVAYTVYGNDATRNGQAIVSINTYDGSTDATKLLEMGTYTKNNASYTDTGATYTNQTDFATKLNSHARYYYNLDSYNVASPSDDAKKLLMWSVYQYAHSSIRKYLNYGEGVDSLGSASAVFDMRGYSYYPVDINSSFSLTGKVTLHNTKFNEAAKDGRDSLKTNSQHYTMQNALFNNVSSTLTVDLSLDGTVNVDDAGNSGALILGTVGNDSQKNPATVTVNALVLDGIRISRIPSDDEETTDIDEGYAPLLINKAGSNAHINISTVSSSGNTVPTGSSTPVYADGTTIATSLLGDIGSATSTNVQLDFSDIKLDGRKGENLDSTNLSGLSSVYNTTRSLFTRATLVNKLAYTGGGSFGRYNYDYATDWGTGSGTPPRTVTYGAEVDGSVENANKQKKYYNDDTHYTHPKNAESTSNEYSNFHSYFLPYSYTGYTGNVTPDAIKAHELQVNISSESFGGCGTYNHPYIVTSESDLMNIATIINGGSPTIPLLLPSDLSTDWCSSHTSYSYSSAGDEWTATGETAIDNEDVREYLAGAYYQLSTALTITLPSNYYSISSEVDDEKYMFRGVIDGNGAVITTESSNPLIEYSDGCVIKDLTIVVKPTVAKTLTQSSAAPFWKVTDNTVTTSEAYGAVIAKVMGGDNILDNVSVDYSQKQTVSGASVPYSVVAKGSASKAELVPIGGYIGVVVNGGVIFRNMIGNDANMQTGITDANLSDFGSKPTSSTNMKWLYINPIIGRVINGYAVTESTSYKPYENGERLYQGSVANDDLENANLTPETWSAGAVTMNNGCKNYSIADIKSIWHKDSAGNVSEYTNSAQTVKYLPDTEKLSINSTSSVIEVPNSQSFFIMSLIVNSGVSNKSLGFNGTYQISRRGLYNEIGTKGAYNATSSADCADYNSRVKDDGTSAYGYLMHYYTTITADISGGTGTQQIELTAPAGSNTYTLPDGYKGIGNLYQNSDAYRMKITNFEGNGATISQNTSFYCYESEYYDSTARAGYKPNGNVDSGLGLVNYANVAGIYQNFYLTGSVKCDSVYSSGSRITDKAAMSCEQKYYLCGGMLIGTANMNTTVTNVALDDIEVFGVSNTGGLIGFITAPTNEYSTITYTVASTVAADAYNSKDIKVYGRASTGGLIGKVNPGYIKVNMNRHTFNLTEVVCESSSRGVNSNYWDYGVGGFVGMIRRGTTTLNEEANYFKNIIIGEEEKEENVKCIKGAEIYTAGVVGIMNKSEGVTVENCDFYNLSVEAEYGAAGLVAFPTTATPAVVKNVNLYSPLGSTIKSTNDYAGGLIGSSDNRQGTNHGSAEFTFRSCAIDNYVIEGNLAAGGVIGMRGACLNKPLNLQNISVTNCTIKSDTCVGALAGEVHKPMYGYNILAKNITFLPISTTPGAEIASAGYICGNLNDSQHETTERGDNVNSQDAYSDGVIKLAGFSRQGTIGVAKLVGNSTYVYDEKYGSGGYVVFADYEDTASGASPNNKFSNMVTSGVSIAEYAPKTARKTERDYTLVEKSDGTIVDVTSILNPSAQSITTPLDEGIQELAEGEQQIAGYGSMMEYESLNSIVTSFSDLTSSRANNGLYLYSKGKGNYITTTWKRDKNNNGIGIISTSKKALPITTDKTKAAVWYFVSIDSTTFKIYTTKYNDSTPQYLKNADATTGADLEFTEDITEAAVFKLSNAYDENAAWNNAVSNSNVNEYNKVKQTDFYRDSFYIKKTPYMPTSTSVNALNSLDYAGLYLQYSNGGTGMRYHENHFKTDQANKAETAQYDSNRTGCIEISYVQELPPVLKSLTYTSGLTYEDSEVNVEGQGRAGTPSQADYLAAITAAGLPNTTTDAKVYIIHQTVLQNTSFGYADNLSPYVTTNPKCNIATGSGVTQFLTGDGVSSIYFDSSAAGKAFRNAVYQNISIDSYSGTHDTERATFGEFIRKNLKSYKSAITINDAAERNKYTGEDFPVLVIDDVSSQANTLLTQYLQILTNSKFDFGKTDDDAYNIDISRWDYQESTHLFEKVTPSASTPVSLKRQVNANGVSGKGFYINSTELDNDNWQFTLLDVQFYDPSDTAAVKTDRKIAYHLYVPIVVSKMLYYQFEARLATGTTYLADSSVYPYSNNNLIENIGNPVTIMFKWTYIRSAGEWEAAINGGECVYRNYRKKFNVRNFKKNFPTSTDANNQQVNNLVLVDHNNDVDKYYSTSLQTILNTHSTATWDDTVDLFDIIGTQNAVKLNDLMDISLAVYKEGDEIPEGKHVGDYIPGNLVIDNNAADADVVAVVNTGSLSGNKLRLKADNETGLYSVNVNLHEPEFTTDDDCLEEIYFLTLFTKDESDQNAFFHYQLDADSNLGETTKYPNARIENVPGQSISDEAMHLSIGYIYENDVSIQEITNSSTDISRSYRTLEATLTSNIGFTSSAVEAGIAGIANNPNVHIYQSFLIGLNRIEDNSGKRGILTQPTASQTNYKINNTSTYGTYPGDGGTANTLMIKASNITNNFVEFPNDSDLRQALLDAIGSHTGKITVETTVSMVFPNDEGQLSVQFPPRDESNANGTIMIGYSNIASSTGAIAGSRASDNTEDQVGHTPSRYCMANATKPVYLSYTAAANDDFKNDGNGNYGQLGINGKEITSSQNYEQVNTVAVYNAKKYGFRNQANYVKVKIKLSKKEGDPGAYGSALDMSDFFNMLELTNKDGDSIAKHDYTNGDITKQQILGSITEDDGVKNVEFISNADNTYTYYIPRALLENENDDDVYTLNIDFQPYSGADFETEEYYYANYKVDISVGLMKRETSSDTACLQGSELPQHMIYTNARLISDVIDVN